MPIAGDQGPLVFTRTAPVLGIAPPAKYPILSELAMLEKTSPSRLVTDAQRVLAGWGINKASELGASPALFLLGEPRKVVRGGKTLVVSKVLNTEVKAWGTLATSHGDNGLFNPNSVAEGFYSGDPLQGQFYVDTYDEGLSFYDNITAAVIDGGIKFNTHSAGYAQAVYHEILHTFEGRNLSPSQILKEGFVEKFSQIFAQQVYGLVLPTYAAYQQYIPDIDKIIKFAGQQTCAKAYFGDDAASLKAMIPIFYGPTNNTLAVGDRLSQTALAEVGRLQSVKDYISPYKMRQPGSWYRDWVQAHGGQVPVGGPALT